VKLSCLKYSSERRLCVHQAGPERFRSHRGQPQQAQIKPQQEGDALTGDPPQEPADVVTRRPPRAPAHHQRAGTHQPGTATTHPGRQHLPQPRFLPASDFGLARRTRRRVRPTRSISTSTRNPNVMTATAEIYRKGVAQSSHEALRSPRRACSARVRRRPWRALDLREVLARSSVRPTASFHQPRAVEKSGLSRTAVKVPGGDWAPRR